MELRCRIIFSLGILTLLLCSCNKKQTTQNNLTDSIVIDRAEYANKLEGFWLGTCVANWTGLITEMDKIGDIGEIKTGNFYTREDWGKADQPSIWGEGLPSNLSPTIDFILLGPDSIWGADDDTDIEYIYQEALLTADSTVLSPEEISAAWLKHIRAEEENYLWVSNQRAFDLMWEGVLPPATSDPINNREYEMIDAQLTTEIFGLYAPGRPDLALQMAELPIQTTARKNSEWISRFYVKMFALAAVVPDNLSKGEQMMWLAENAKDELPSDAYARKMYDFVLGAYRSGLSWEITRDSIYQRYQVEQADGYDLTSRGLYCNACFAAGINFAASLVSFFYGQGELKETIKIGALAGWDSDNPTATWGGLIGFMLGRDGVEAAFGKKLSNRYNIHRTRQGFANNGVDDFTAMAIKGLRIIDRVVLEAGGIIDQQENRWLLPQR
ncbi:heme biosynthesis protein HemY [Lewinellaceae bacterium SD302]|nr:heme biosynthesis protein HemY [Lewinellaceae bacterium SD302]